jgi:hypothetical protein
MSLSTQARPTSMKEAVRFAALHLRIIPLRRRPDSLSGTSPPVTRFACLPALANTTEVHSSLSGSISRLSESGIGISHGYCGRGEHNVITRAYGKSRKKMFWLRCPTCGAHSLLSEFDIQIEQAKRAIFSSCYPMAHWPPNTPTGGTKFAWEARLISLWPSFKITECLKSVSTERNGSRPCSRGNQKTHL